MFKINISNMKRYLLIFMCIAVPFFVYSQNDTLLSFDKTPSFGICNPEGSNIRICNPV